MSNLLEATQILTERIDALVHAYEIETGLRVFYVHANGRKRSGTKVALSVQLDDRPDA